MTTRGERGRRRGYSLVEILIVLAIMGLVVAVAAPMAMKQFDEGRRKTSLLSAHGIKQATSVWKLRGEAADCPTPGRLMSDRVMERGSAMADAWGNPFVIVCDEDGVTVRSAGKDRRDGTDDDIVAPPEVRAASR